MADEKDASESEGTAADAPAGVKPGGPDRLAADDAHRPRGAGAHGAVRGEVEHHRARRPRVAREEARRRGRALAAQLHEAVAAHRLGRVLGRHHRQPGRDRPFPVPERAVRAAAVVQGGLPRRVQRRRGGHALEGRLQRLDRARGGRLLRPHRRLHAPRLHAQLAARREQVQVPLPRQRLLPHGRELRGAGAPAARARAHRPLRRRPDPGGQVGQVPAGTGRVG